MTAPALQTYDFPWGTRTICPRTHEATIGGDGYGDRCCGTADVETVEESSADCERHLCLSCCDDTCCRACHAQDVTDDEEICRQCQAELAYESRKEAALWGRYCGPGCAYCGACEG